MDKLSAILTGARANLRGLAPMVALLLGLSVTAQAQSAAVVGRSFAGSPQFLFDADGAAGPSHYGEITNLSFRVTSLATGTVVYNSASLAQFWGTKVGLPLLSGCCFDPQLEYDQASARWIAVSLSGQSSATSAVYVGISDTSDPSGGWKGLTIDADPSDLRWADLPQLGLDGAGVYISVGMPGIAATTPFRKAFFILPKSDLTGSTPTAARLSRFLSEFPTTSTSDFQYEVNAVKDRQGAAIDGLHIAASAQPTWVLSGSTMRWAVGAIYQRMTGQASGAATLLPWATTPSYLFDSTSNPSPSSIPPDLGRQPGTATRLNNGGTASDVRVGDAVYSVTSTYVRGRLGIIWRRFQPSTNTIVDAGFIGDDVNDYLGPSIAANARGEAVIAYTRTSLTEYGSFYFSAGRPDGSGHLVFGAPTLVKAGTDIYDANGPVKSPGIARFIDYATAVSVQPSESRFWISGPYVSARNVGATWIAEVILPGPAPASLTLQRYGPTGVILNWSAPQGATSYIVKRGMSPGGETVYANGITGTTAYIVGAKNTRYYFTVSAISGGVESGNSNEVAITLSTNAGRNDIDGDGVSDLMVYRPTSGNWFSRNSSAGYVVGAGNWNFQWGAAGDLPMSSDFDGDGTIDPAVFRPTTGQWFILYSTHGFNPGQFGYLEWGAAGDVPFAADFDGDGLSDIGVFRPSNGYWYLRLSGQGWTIGAGNWIFAWGASGDVPITGDLDADGRADIGVFRPATGQWFFRYSSLNYDANMFGYFEWGATGDVNLTADFDGDARSDIGVFRPSTGQWFLRLSTLGYNPAQYGYFEWGASGDLPKMGDWDGDGRGDVTVYRPSSGGWFIRYSSQGWSNSQGQFGHYEWGATGDTPLPTR